VATPVPAARLDRLAPTVLAALGAIVFLVVAPRPVDLAAHVYRADLFAREGFTLWNGNWYGGHHTPAYSVLFPPLAALLTPTVVGALAAVGATAAFEALVRGAWGRRARYGALWFGLGSATLLFTGRLPFALGVALGLAALLALQKRRTALAAVAAVACSLASPVAGLFLAMAAVAQALAGGRLRRASALVAVAALVPVAVLSAAFPEGGWEPFVVSAFWPVLLFCAAALAFLPAEQRALRIGAALYALAAIAAYVLHTPMGGNVVRLGALFGGPLLLAVELRGKPSPRRSLLLAVTFTALLVWQWHAAVRDVRKVSGDPAAQASFYRPLVEQLEAAGGLPGRVEVPFTRAHWEAAEVAPHFPLARGWQRQLDIERNPIFYDGPLNAATYRDWLGENGVRFVALANAVPDYTSKHERELIESGLPYLRQVWSSDDWGLFEVTSPHPMVVPVHDADIRLTRLGSDQLDFDVRRAGTAVIRVAWSPYWVADGACVERAGEWTRLITRRAGTLRMRMEFGLGRVFDRGRRCA
jgi:hypothetical protein